MSTPDSSPTPPADKGDALAVAFFLALFVVSLASMFYLFQSFLTDILLSSLYAVLSNNIDKKLLAKVKNPILASTMVCLLVVVVIALPTGFLIASLSAEAASAYDATKDTLTIEHIEAQLFGDGWISGYLHKFTQLTGITITPESVKNSVTGVAGTIAKFVYTKANDIVGNVFAGLFHFIMQILMLFYLLIDGKRFKRYIFNLSPLPDSEEELLAQKFGDVGRAILFGNGMGSILQGLLGGIAMAVIGLPSAVLWGTVMSIFAFLPLVGISVVVIPATLYLLAIGAYAKAIGFLVFCMVEALFVENVIKTRLIGNHMKMHNLLIFMSIIGGIAAFGILGLLYGPLLVTLFLTLEELYQKIYKNRIRDPLART